MKTPQVCTSETRLRLLHRPAQLYVLLDGRASLGRFQSLTEQLVTAGVHVLQLRDKSLTDRDLVARARLLSEVTRNSATLSIINDRPEIAFLAGADGVHVGQEELTVSEARTIVGPDRLVGVSTHSIVQLRQAVQDGADYLGCGPTFPSTTKSFGEFPGIAFLERAIHELDRPAFAIGGIDASNLERVLAIGWTRIAVSSAVVQAAEPSAAASWLMTRLAGPGSSSWLADPGG